MLPALYGSSSEQTHQVMLFLSAADDFGGAGGYSLKAAKTKYTVTVHDNMGNILSDPADDRVFGGAGASEIAGTSIIVEGIEVTTDAGACGGEEDARRGLDSRRSDGARSRGVFRHRQICWSGRNVGS